MEQLSPPPTATPSAVRAISPERLSDVSCRGDALLQTIEWTDKRAVCQQLAHLFRGVLDADLCVLSLGPVGAPETTAESKRSPAADGMPASGVTGTPGLIVEIHDRHGGVLGIVAVTRAARWTREDRDVADLLAQKVAIPLGLLRTLEEVQKKLTLESWGQAASDAARDPGGVADHLLLTACGQFGLDGGVVYTAIPRASSLHSCAGRGCDRDIRADPIVYKFDEQAAATHAYNEVEAFFSLDPTTDRRVEPGGREKCGIRGTLFAVRLCDGGEKVGVLVVWHREKRLSEKEAARTLDELRELARLASPRLRIALFGQTSRQRRDLQESAARVLQQMMTGCDLQANIGAIFEGVQALGFRRIRLYRFRYGDRFEGERSLGMGSKEGWFPTYTIFLSNPYLKRLHDEVCDARRDPTKAGLLLARVYPLKELGPDPSREKLAKPEGMPWAEVPIVSAGKLYGMLAVDKLRPNTEPPRWDEITDVDLDGLDLFGQLLGRAFAQHEKRGMLIPSHIAELERRVGPAEPHDVVRCRLLLFLTHGEEGLGFSRALLFEPADTPGHFRFVLGIGSVRWARWNDIAYNTCHQRLATVLDNADPHCDQELCEAMARCRIVAEDTSDNPLGKQEATLYRAGAGAPEWVERVRQQLPADDLLVAPVRAGGRTLGVLVVDRCWQPFGLIEADAERLWSFAQRTGYILLQHDVVRHRLEGIEIVLRGVLHEVRQPLGQLRNYADALAAQSQPFAEHIQSSIDELNRQVSYFDELARPPGGSFVDTNAQALFDALVEAAREPCRNAGVTLHVHKQCTADVPLSVMPKSLEMAVKNLARNAADALQTVANPDKTITVSGEIAGGCLLVTVSDNGPGIPPDSQRHFQQEGLMPSSKLGRGLGLGLWLVQKVIEQHSGRLRLVSLPGQGTSVILEIPCSLRGAV